MGDAYIIIASCTKVKRDPLLIYLLSAPTELDQLPGAREPLYLVLPL